jgi:K+-transporting ATPase ATPase A chain
MANNGQTMAGLDANRAFYNLTTPIAMLAGRIGLAGLALTLAGRLATQGRKASGLGALPSDTATFGVLVLATVLVIGALSFLPVLALGPIVEQFQR